MRRQSWLLPAVLLVLLGAFLTLRRLERQYEPKPATSGQAAVPTISIVETSGETSGGTTGSAGTAAPIVEKPTAGSFTSQMSEMETKEGPATQESLIEHCLLSVDRTRLVALGDSDTHEMLSRHAICVSLAKGDASPCDSLTGQWRADANKEAMPPAEACKAEYQATRYWAALVSRDPSVKSQCEQMFGSASIFRDPKAACDKFDGIIDKAFDRSGKTLAVRNIDEVCDRTSALLKPGRSAEEFKAKCREWVGIASCKNIKWVGPRSLCEDRAAMAAALPTNDGALCGHSGLCLALLTASPQPCAKTMDDAVRAFCAKVSANDFSMMVSEENAFRRLNHLAPYKSGDVFLGRLPLQERYKYEKHRKTAKTGTAAPAQEEAPAAAQ